MYICKDCLIRHQWRPERTPVFTGDCELCWDHDTDVFELTKTEKFDFKNVNSLEAAAIFEEAGKTLDKAENFEYKRMCENLHMYFERGPQAGQIDYDLTENFLNQINVFVNEVIDWKATYKRRLRAKYSFMSVQERIGGY